jgi:hypothetical protein
VRRWALSIVQGPFSAAQRVTIRNFFIAVRYGDQHSSKRKEHLTQEVPSAGELQRRARGPGAKCGCRGNVAL